MTDELSMARGPGAAARLRKGRAKVKDTTVLDDFLLRPDPLDPGLTELVSGRDEQGREVETRVVVERPLTLFLNAHWRSATC
jgi:FdhD protein